MKKILLIATVIYSSTLFATCEVVDGGKKTPFDGKNVGGMSVEKKSLSILNKEFPDLNKFNSKLKRKIRIFAVRRIKDLKNEHLINNVLNGIKIQGSVKWI